MREGVALCTHRLIVRGQKTVPRCESRAVHGESRRGLEGRQRRSFARSITRITREPLLENHNLKKERRVIFLDLSINRLDYPVV